jgi:hypothetical protein
VQFLGMRDGGIVCASAADGAFGLRFEMIKIKKVPKS